MRRWPLRHRRAEACAYLEIKQSTSKLLASGGLENWNKFQIRHLKYTYNRRIKHVFNNLER